jgi:Zn-finger nucleic acid-binding protein
MNCPKCENSALVKTMAEAIAVDRCPSCSGIWFDERELPALLAADPAILRPLIGGSDRRHHTDRPGSCPRDGAALLRAYSARAHSVVVDTCPQCRGVWLDGGELRTLIAAPRG